MTPLYVNWKCTVCERPISNHGAARYNHAKKHEREKKAVVKLDTVCGSRRWGYYKGNPDTREAEGTRLRGFMGDDNKQRWGYSITKWWMRPHFYVTLFVSYSEIKRLAPFASISQKFDTREEANAFVRKLRKALREHQVALEQHGRDLCKV